MVIYMAGTLIHQCPGVIEGCYWQPSAEGHAGASAGWWSSLLASRCAADLLPTERTSEPSPVNQPVQQGSQTSSNDSTRWAADLFFCAAFGLMRMESVADSPSDATQFLRVMTPLLCRDAQGRKLCWVIPWDRFLSHRSLLLWAEQAARALTY